MHSKSLNIYRHSCFLNGNDGYIEEVPAALWLRSSLYLRTQTQGWEGFTDTAACIHLSAWVWEEKLSRLEIRHGNTSLNKQKKPGTYDKRGKSRPELWITKLCNTWLCDVCLPGIFSPSCLENVSWLNAAFKSLCSYVQHWGFYQVQTEANGKYPSIIYPPIIYTV